MASSITKVPPGFEGSLSIISLTDILQLEHQTRFSGSIVVSNGELEGRIFLQDGEVVHAETGALKGEDAIGVILTWHTGSFVAHANVSTVACTIDKGLDHLLLEVHRRIDEQRKTSPDALPSPRAPSPSGARRAAPGVLEKVRAVPGVSYAVLFDRAGVARADPSSMAETLAAESLYLVSMIASPIGEALGVGELRQVAARSERDQLLLFKSRDTYLSVSVAGSSSLVEAEAAIRRALNIDAGGA